MTTPSLSASCSRRASGSAAGPGTGSPPCFGPRGARFAPSPCPALDSAATPRAGVTLDDHVRAVVDVLAERPARPAVLVGHSGAGVVVYAATDRAPHFVHRAVYVDSAPLPDGAAIRPDLAPGVVELPLPPWEELEAAGTSLAGLDERDLAEFRRRGVPHPAGPAREPLR